MTVQCGWLCASTQLGISIPSGETDFHLFHELEQSTIIRSGATFLERSSTRIRRTPFRFSARCGGQDQRSSKSSSWAAPWVASSPYTVSLGDSSWTITPSVTGSQSHVPQAQVGGFWNWTPSSEVVQVGITLDAQVADAKGWLDYLRLHGSRQASMSGSPNKNSCGPSGGAGTDRRMVHR